MQEHSVLKERPNLILEACLLPHNNSFLWPRQIIKRFKCRGIQLFFTPLKQSKARKSYMAACHLLEHELDTPVPLGAIECRKLGFVVSNTLITEVITDCIDLKKYKKQLPEGRTGMDAVVRLLAQYITRMHDSGLWHRDLNLSNFLLTGKKGSHRLYLVDLNRAKILPKLSMNHRAGDIARLELKRWQELFMHYYCADRFNIKQMTELAEKFRTRRRIWRNVIVRTNPMRIKLGWK